MSRIGPDGPADTDHAVRFRLVHWRVDQHRPCGKESVSESGEVVAGAASVERLAADAAGSGGELPIGDRALAERLAAWRLSGSLAREGRNLSIHFRLKGPMDQLELPPVAERPERRDELWRGTCLEFFLAALGEEGYREFNLSPAGHWNVYRFNGYRSGMVPDPDVQSLPFQVRSDVDSLRLDLVWTLPVALADGRRLELGVCAVIVPRGGEPTYWALAHPGAEPDFHRREGFQLLI